MRRRAHAAARGENVAAPAAREEVATQVEHAPRRSAKGTQPPSSRDAGSIGVSRVAAPESLAKLAKQLAHPPRRTARGTRKRDDGERSPSTRSAKARDAIEARAGGPLDLATPPRTVSLELIGGRGHYERVIAAILGAHTSVWIATANVKGLMVEDHRAAPGRRRSMRRSSYVSILTHLDDLAARGVELRLLHAELPSGPFREEIANHPRLVAGGLALARCPRVHMKAVIVDGALLYLGSANWTGAGLGAKGTGRRNFELGIVTEDGSLLDQVQGLFERIWSGGECAGCKVRELCPGPLDEVRGLVNPPRKRGRSST